MVTTKPKGLGRGLDALLGPRVDDATERSEASAPSTLLLTDLVPGQYQPRTRMDEGALYELAESIKVQGIMQPILVRRLNADKLGGHSGQYEIIAGERRFRAALLAGLASVPVLVRDVPDESAAAMSLIENIQRENLNPLEEAQGLQRLIDEFGLTHETAAHAVGRSRSAASNLMRLLHLAPPVQSMLMAGDIDMGHARALLMLDTSHQVSAANTVVAKKMSVREAERLVKKLGAGQALPPPPPPAALPPDLLQLEADLSTWLGASVKVRAKQRTLRNGQVTEAGEISIRYGSPDELAALLSKLRPPAAV